MPEQQIILITGTRKGIGRYLADYYAGKGFQVIGCSRHPVEGKQENYQHFVLDVSDESRVREMFADVRKTYKKLDVLINNAGIASMNHALLTPLDTVGKILNTNVAGTFLFCREAAKIMQKKRSGRIVNFTSVAAPLRLEGEAIYAASKAAVESLTRILAKELAPFGVTVNAVGPTPTKTDLIRSVPQEKMEKLVKSQAIPRYGEFRDITNVVDFFIQPESDFITGQIIYLGGIN